jgi:hypothetical protein
VGDVRFVGYETTSSDGRIVAFTSAATNLVPNDTNGIVDAFVRDRVAATTTRASVDSAGAQTNGSGGGFLSVSSDGPAVAFGSPAADLVTGDTNGLSDVFVHEDASDFTSLCDPGVAGVIACPCSNAPSGSGRGCNNSSATGGAILQAAGSAYLGAQYNPFDVDQQNRYLAANGAGNIGSPRHLQSMLQSQPGAMDQRMSLMRSSTVARNYRQPPSRCRTRRFWSRCCHPPPGTLMHRPS